MFRDKKKLEEMYSSKRTWSKMGKGLFTNYTKDLKPEERIKIIGKRCDAVQSTFIDLDKIDAVKKDPRLGKIMEYIGSGSMEEPMDQAKRVATEFFALGGTPSEAEDFIRKLEEALSTAAMTVLEWQLPDFSKSKASIEDKEYEKLSTVSHELRNTITSVGSRFVLILAALKEVQSEIHGTKKE